MALNIFPDCAQASVTEFSFVIEFWFLPKLDFLRF